MKLKKKKQWFKKTAFLFGGILLLFFFFSLGKRFLPWFSTHWDGLSEISWAIETKQGEILILSINPGNKMVVLLRLPSKLEIETPWFGNYQAGKLPLLARQENNADIFPKSLTYYLRIPVEYGIMATNLELTEDESALKERLRKIFLFPASIDYWRAWLAFGDKELFWKVINLAKFAKENPLPDGNFSLRIDDSQVSSEIGNYFIDPLIKNENLSLSIFNTGKITGFAQRISFLANNIGIRVVETGDREPEGGEDCLITVSKRETQKTLTVSRLRRLLGCKVEVKIGGGMGDVQILIGNVRI